VSDKDAESTGNFCSNNQNGWTRLAWRMLVRNGEQRGGKFADMEFSLRRRRRELAHAWQETMLMRLLGKQRASCQSSMKTSKRP